MELLDTGCLCEGKRAQTQQWRLACGKANIPEQHSSVHWLVFVLDNIYLKNRDVAEIHDIY